MTVVNCTIPVLFEVEAVMMGALGAVDELSFVLLAALLAVAVLLLLLLLTRAIDDTVDWRRRVVLLVLLLLLVWAAGGTAVAETEWTAAVDALRWLTAATFSLLLLFLCLAGSWEVAALLVVVAMVLFLLGMVVAFVDDDDGVRNCSLRTSWFLSEYTHKTGIGRTDGLVDLTFKPRLPVIPLTLIPAPDDEDDDDDE